MSDKYCPAGQIHCKLWYGHCDFISVFAGFANSVIHFDACPWPTQQQPIVNLKLTDRGEGFKAGHAAGRLAGLQEAMEAVANIRLRFDSDTPGNVDLTLPEFQWVRDKALAAIDRLMGGK